MDNEYQGWSSMRSALMAAILLSEMFVAHSPKGGRHEAFSPYPKASLETSALVILSELSRLVDVARKDRGILVLQSFDTRMSKDSWLSDTRYIAYLAKKYPREGIDAKFIAGVLKDKRVTFKYIQARTKPHGWDLKIGCSPVVGTSIIGILENGNYTHSKPQTKR